MSKNRNESAHRPARGQPDHSAGDRRSSQCDDIAGFSFDFFDAIGIMAIMIDDGGIIRQFNRKAEDLTGYSNVEAIGHDWFTLMVPEQKRIPAREQLMGGLRQGVEHMALSVPVIARNGGNMHVCWSLIPARDDHGKIVGLVGIGFIPSSPDAPCIEAGRELESYCTSVSAMSHDLLNHSQVVMGYLEMATERSGDNKELRCMLARAHESMVKCGKIALDVQRISNGRLK